PVPRAKDGKSARCLTMRLPPTSARSYRLWRCVRESSGPWSSWREPIPRSRSARPRLVWSLKACVPRITTASQSPAAHRTGWMKHTSRLLKAFVETSMQQLGIPGVSIALVDGGKVVYEGGFGVRELGKPERVDENTVFMAASNTKGITTLLLAELVDDKKLRWDEPVVDVYPAFKLGDAETTKQVLVKNLICACTGVPRQDMEWLFEFKNATPETELALLGTMQPTSKFGEVF